MTDADEDFEAEYGVAEEPLMPRSPTPSELVQIAGVLDARAELDTTHEPMLRNAARFFRELATRGSEDIPEEE